jgi:hypothetical protein
MRSKKRIHQKYFREMLTKRTKVESVKKKFNYVEGAEVD